jgi:hypothetical protein
MDKVQKPSSNEYYTPSSESFRIYKINVLPKNDNTFLRQGRQPLHQKLETEPLKVSSSPSDCII